MKKPNTLNNYAVAVIIPVALCLFDQWSKAFAKDHFSSVSIWGPFETGLLYNQGFFLGTMTSLLPHSLRIILLTSIGAFLICIYAVLQSLIPHKMNDLRLGLAIWLGGIAGNLADRILQGSVLDFVELKLGLFSSPVFNLADAIQWPGIALTVYGLIRHYDEFWPQRDLRKIRMINYSFQVKFILITSFYCLGSIFLTLVYSIPFIKLIGSHAVNPPIVASYAFGLICFQGIYLFGVIFTSLLVSNRIAGPVYSFVKYVRSLCMGSKNRENQKRVFRLREGDYFPELESTAEELTHLLKKNHIPKS